MGIIKEYMDQDDLALTSMKKTPSGPTRSNTTLVVVGESIAYTSNVLSMAMVEMNMPMPKWVKSVDQISSIGVKNQYLLIWPANTSVFLDQTLDQIRPYKRKLRYADPVISELNRVGKYGIDEHHVFDDICPCIIERARFNDIVQSENYPKDLLYRRPLSVYFHLYPPSKLDDYWNNVVCVNRQSLDRILTRRLFQSKAMWWTIGGAPLVQYILLSLKRKTVK